ncbi:hypothetical protein ABW11_00170 [Pluralibacter gergoviae]|nr:hypothetical protein ABW08_00170 [Pluralibacter gergoviae]KMK30009.1 hypothetical protein ABW11_00170 [Pluralibacter gergoviae]KOQ80034.1 hypothetical protein ABW48_27105 [Pluralibacter gergoviae]SUB72336.1 Uncharacterised protein [Pluralibacter gergoviae]
MFKLIILFLRMFFTGPIVCVNGISVWSFLRKFEVALHRGFTIVGVMGTFPVIIILPFCQQILQVIS